LSDERQFGSFIFSLFLLIVTGLFFREALRINTLGISWGGPRLFPLLISGGSFAASLAITVSEGLGVLKRDTGGRLLAVGVPPVSALKEALSVIALIAGVAAYALTVERLGFLLSTFAITLYSALTFKARLIDAIVLSLVASLGLYMLFSVVLGVPLPGGVSLW